ncbi:MAG TPA: GTPase domain-containing protein [Limnochordales bacterium]
MSSAPLDATADACVVGRPGVGKTLFVLRFAQWCGQRRLLMRQEAPGSSGGWVEVDLATAVDRLVGTQTPTTRALQHVEVPWRQGKRTLHLRLLDTVGLTDTIHPDPLLRRAMAETLTAVMESLVVLHVLDGPRIAQRPGRLLDEDDVDVQIGRYGERRGRYAVLVNKLDRPGGRAGLEAVRRAWPHRIVLGISALEGWGFASVRRFLQRRL